MQSNQQNHKRVLMKFVKSLSLIDWVRFVCQYFVPGTLSGLSLHAPKRKVILVFCLFMLYDYV